MKKLILFLLMAFVSNFFITKTFAQTDADKSIITVKSKEVVKTRSNNTYIVSKAPEDDTKPLPPVSKKGDKTFTGKEFEVTLDNFTGYCVEVYVDGHYQGTVGGWGKLVVTQNNSYKTLYCITTGGSKDWLIKGNYDGSFTFELK